MAGGLVHGIDVVQVESFGRWLRNPQSRLRDRFTSRELEHAADAHEIEHLAACFAVKEAVLKALGLGAGSGLGWHEIELDHDSAGAPAVRLSGRAEAVGRELNVTDLVVSISHAGGIAVASVVGQRAG